MAASAAGRSSSCLRIICRMPMNSGARASISPMHSSIPANFLPRRIPLSPSPFRVLRRELSSILPLHCAIASACLVSQLPMEASSSTEGRFANYLSPI